MVNLQDPTVAPLATHPPPPPPEPPLEAQSQSQQSGLSTVTLGAELLQGVQDFLSGASAAGSAVTVVAPVSQNSSFTVDSVLNNPSHDVAAAAHVAEKLSLASEQPPGKAVQPVSVSPPIAPPSSEGGPFAELSNVVVASAASPSAALSPPPSGGTTTVLQPLAISLGGAVTSSSAEAVAAVDAVNLALVQEIRRPDSPSATISTSKVRRTLRPSFPRPLARLLFLPRAAELDLFKCKLRWENQYWTTTNRPRPSLIARRPFVRPAAV